MGRSVSVPISAELIAYAPLEDDVDFLHDVTLPLSAALQLKYPSLREDDRWIGREDKALLSNSYATFGVSEYGGLLAVWVIPADVPRAQHWVASITDSFNAIVVRTFGKRYARQGTMSNGCGVYTAVED
jgi:hypothetical protein